jgi:transposase-like protein
MNSPHSKEFRDAIVLKILNRNNKSIREVCEGENIGVSTASNWLRSAKMPAMVKKAEPKKWTSKEKLRVISESLSSSEKETGILLRKEGLHSHQLEEWKTQVLLSLESKAKKQVKSTDERDVHIKKLEQEILRKDKALAEASALLILKKKVDLIWGDEEKK